MTAWLLTWLWQGSAIAAGVAIGLRYAPRRNAATRHLIWYVALAAVAWLGWASSPHQTLVPLVLPDADPIYVPSVPDVLVTAFVGVWAAIALVYMLRVLPGLRAPSSAGFRCGWKCAGAAAAQS